MKLKMTLVALFLNIGLMQGQETLNDAEITDAIEDQYRVDHSVNINSVGVITNEGIVQLIGSVKNIEAKERATKLASLVKGVRSVSNQIKVDPVPGLNDTTIKTYVEHALISDPATDAYELIINVKDGIVTLDGEVDSYQESALCEHVAKSVRGVVDLQNKITVNYKTDRADGEIEKEIVEALKWNKFVDDGLIDVKVKKGKVKLTGVVGSLAEKRNATYNGWVAGVKDVDADNLSVEWWANDQHLRANKANITDDEVAQAIKDAALYDPRIFSFKINPEVNNGWVTLRGKVTNLKARKAAEKLAENTTGVMGITNRLKVENNVSISDEEIKYRLENALTTNAITEAWEVNVSVINGIVTLTGLVDSYLEKNEAEWLARGIKGVDNVNSLISVNYPYSYYWYENYPGYDWYYPTLKSEIVSFPNDKAIKRTVEREIWWSPFVDASQVKVEVNNGKVILKGEVDSWKEYHKAAENAWEGGAWFLDNNLTVDQIQEN